MSPVLRIGTRGSDLALWQARHVAALLARVPGAPNATIEVIQTEGDRVQDVQLSRATGKAFFTKEIENALLEGTIDLAVHSLKDLATVVPPGLALGAVLEREDPRDALLSIREVRTLDELPRGARVGTSSLRRCALLRRWRPDLEIVELRGNVPTRIEKMDAGQSDAIVIAAAGVKRLGLGDRIRALLPPERILPAVSQGAMGVEIRANDERTAGWVRWLDHRPTRLATEAERALLRRLEGGCQIPVGALATLDGEQLTLRAIVCSVDGTTAVDGHRGGRAENPSAIGIDLAEELLERGAASILEAIRLPMGG
jgi:hydroxymethylbilane synthase